MGNSILGLMDSFLQSALRMEKQATDPSEPTTHPVMSVDDGTQKAQTGARDTENKKDVRESLGEAGITGQEDASAAGDGTVAADSIGTQKMDSTEVKGNVQTPKATKDGPAEKGRGDASPGHPTNQTFQEKYSSVNEIIKLANEILAEIATTKSAEDRPEEISGDLARRLKKGDPFVTKVKKETAAERKDEEEAKKSAALKYRKDAEEGYITAQRLADAIVNKNAETKEAEELLTGVVKSAQDDAVILCDFLEGLQKGAQVSKVINRPHMKRAQMPMDPAMLAGAGAGGPPEGGIPPELLAAAGGPGGGGPPPDMGGGGMPPDMAGGGMPPDMAGGGGAGGGDEEAAIEALADALAQAGVTPEELAQVISEQQGEGGQPVGGPPEGGEPAALEEGASAGGGAAEGEGEQEEKEEKEEPKKAAAFKQNQAKQALSAAIRKKVGK